MLLEVKNLVVDVNEKRILNGIDLSINEGEIHAIMGPNGSGKSTLGFVLMGHPNYSVVSGDILFCGKSVLNLKPDERAKLGLFLGFQYPFEVQGLGFGRFMLQALKHYSGKNVSVLDFQKLFEEKLLELKFKKDFFRRELNVGFSGGEKKRGEVLQLSVLKPKLSILDEIDSGLDVDSLKMISRKLNEMRNGKFSAIVITHYKRILNYFKPDVVHILAGGKIIATGKSDLADEVDEKGYSWLLKENKLELEELKRGKLHERKKKRSKDCD